MPLLGDWDCDGVDTVAMYRPGNGFVSVRNSNEFGFADEEFFYGIPGDRVVLGDWDRDGDETVAIFRPQDGRWYLSNENVQGPAASACEFGEAGWLPLAGGF